MSPCGAFRMIPYLSLTLFPRTIPDPLVPPVVAVVTGKLTWASVLRLT